MAFFVVLDSNAVLPSGLVDHQYTSVGSFKQCMRIHTQHLNKPVDGQYCFLTFKISNSTKNSSNELETKWLKRTLKYNIRFPYALGLCIPDSCSSEELTQIFIMSEAIKQTNMQNIQVQYCQTDNKYNTFELIIQHDNIYSM